MITETEVVEWFRDRMKQFNAEGMPVHAMTLSVHDSYAHWSMHAAGKCSAGEKTVLAAAAELRCELFGNPQKEAQEKRRKAARLLKDAEKLEALASRKEGA